MDAVTPKGAQTADTHSHLVRPDSMEWQKTRFLDANRPPLRWKTLWELYLGPPAGRCALRWRCLARACSEL